MNKDKKAFPYQYLDNLQEVQTEHGMTLRDYFANSAMDGIIASTTGIGLEINENHIKIVAKKAYMYADAMLKEREK